MGLPVPHFPPRQHEGGRVLSELPGIDPDAVLSGPEPRDVKLVGSSPGSRPRAEGTGAGAF